MHVTLPVYPDYKKIDIEDKDYFLEFCNKYPPYSDFNLLSLLSWNTANSNSYSVLNGNLVIKIKDYLENTSLYSLMGDNDIDTSISKLLAQTPKLSFVPEDVISKIKQPEKFKITEDRDNFDYIISTQKVFKLDGHEFMHLRQDVQRFKRTNSLYETKLLDLKNAQTVNEVTTLSKKWFKDKHFDDEKQKEEEFILEAFLKYSAKFNCLHVGLYVNNILIAYIFSEIISDKMLLSHFGVSDKDFECSSPMMEYEAAKYFYEHGYTYQNQEQDAGLLGLRAAKLFYNPEYFLKKFIITLAT